MDKTAETLIDVSGFISEYSAHMMGCGVHTSRVIRSANRIGESFGYMVKISVIQKKKRRDIIFVPESVPNRCPLSGLKGNRV